MAKLKLPTKKPAAAAPAAPSAAPAQPAAAPSADPSQGQDTSQIAPRDDRVLLRRLDGKHEANAVLTELISQVDDSGPTVPKPKGTKVATPESSPRYVLATVEQVGPGDKNEDGQVIPNELQPGDIVLVDGYSFEPGSNFALVSENSVRATIKEQPDQTQQQPVQQPGQAQAPQLPPQMPGGMQ